jgi:sucrose-6-phosphate hydrolase SacC (GH32 family)
VARFRPSRDWINDPNGLIVHGGLWHLFFQTNPEGVDWGTMSWGHATSPDLATWTEHAVALPCTAEEQIFSGSVVHDVANTSGLGRDGVAPLVAVYTSHYSPGSPRHGTQAQSLASSTDGGFTWTPFPGNPVLTRGTPDFRDPKVFREVDGWTMVVVEAADHLVLRYRSPDLRAWTLDGWLRVPGEGLVECPDVFPLAIEGELHEVLLVSVGPVAPGRGTGMRYTIDPVWRQGEPDPTDLGETPWPLLDHGPDCYAGTTFNDAPDGRRIFLAWMSNWDYAADVPLDGGRGRMTTPRELSLVRGEEGPVLRQWPVGVPEAAFVQVADEAGTETFDEGGTRVTTTLAWRPPAP